MNCSNNGSISIPNSKTIRKSNFELLRIVCMLFIVSYHFLRYLVENDNVSTPIVYKATWLPLHIAVICFVLISGYFHIRPTFKGALKLLLPVLVYYAIPCFIVRCCGITDYIGGGNKQFSFCLNHRIGLLRHIFACF